MRGGVEMAVIGMLPSPPCMVWSAAVNKGGGGRCVCAKLCSEGTRNLPHITVGGGF